MLEISLERAVYPAGRVGELVVVLHNPAAAPLTNIRLRLALPATLLLVDGGESFALERLPAGETARHRLSIKPQQVGEWAITSPNCSFRDALGTTYRKDDLRLLVHVVAAPVAAPAAYARPSASSPSAATVAAWRQQLNANTRLIDAHQRRLQKRREQLAIFGYMADPVISMEIDEIERQIARLEGENARLHAQLGE